MSYLFLAVGILLLIGGIILALRQRIRLARWSNAEGVVSQLLPIRQTGETLRKQTAEGLKVVPKRFYRPVIEFMTEAGRNVQFKASLSTRPAVYLVGDKVTVRYEPEDPEKAIVESRLELWFYPGMLVGFGLFAIVMGVVGILRG